MQEKAKIEERIIEIESLMTSSDFWVDKNKAQEVIKELEDLKDKLEGVDKYDKGSAIINIFSGAGGDDAEDFSAMLFKMYFKWAGNNNFSVGIIDENKNTHGGYRNISFKIKGKNVYGILKNESGVHRLVRLSPFNAKSLRQTSFSLVEVLPVFEKKDFVLPESELEITFTKSSGPGGQNVNKRETAVRVVHKETGLSVVVSSERSQAQNKEQAIALIEAKIFKRKEEEKLALERGMKISKDTKIEWGSQIRSYVLHPYKMVKDHRNDTETSNAEGVLDGNIDIFLKKG